VTIARFAEAHRLRTAVDDDNTTIIPGRSGQIYEHGDGRLGVIFTSGDRFETREGWNNRRKACAAVGMTVHQDGDYEGSLLFDPRNTVQVQTAIQVSGVRPRKRASATQLAALKRGRQPFQKRIPHVENDPLQAAKAIAEGGMA
jgi:hypothetical protein